jgi:hypothetical protein
VCRCFDTCTHVCTADCKNSLLHALVKHLNIPSLPT